MMMIRSLPFVVAFTTIHTYLLLPRRALSFLVRGVDRNHHHSWGKRRSDSPSSSPPPRTTTTSSLAFPVLGIQSAPTCWFTIHSMNQNVHHVLHGASKNMPDTTPKPIPRVHAPSRYVMDVRNDGVDNDDNDDDSYNNKTEKWRLCVGVAVLNSRHEVLVGERIHIPGAWQCPQGGVDDAWFPSISASSADTVAGGDDGEDSIDKSDTSISGYRPRESILDAAKRELYEEMGLIYGKHVLRISPLRDDDDHNNNNNNTGDDQDDDDDIILAKKELAIRYRTSGTDNWLTREGFAGQQLHWIIFRCVDARGDRDPLAICDISGQGIEEPEFRTVQWQSIDQILSTMWEPKRPPYQVLQNMILQSRLIWDDHIQSIGLEGKWRRDTITGTPASNLIEYLLARGLTKERATEEIHKPYVQEWERVDSSTSWLVTTFESDGITVRRSLTYPIGYWDETYQGNSVLFDDAVEPAKLCRYSCYVAEPEGIPASIAHVTLTDMANGIEESRRYTNNKKLFLRRTFWPHDKSKPPAISVETFVRVK